MIRIINGKRYNTETASLLASWSNGFNCTDFDYCSQDLYITANGAFFIHGEGGARSIYSRRYGNSYGWGQAISAASNAEAKSFCERHGDPEVTAKYFTVVDA